MESGQEHTPAVESAVPSPPPPPPSLQHASDATTEATAPVDEEGEAPLAEASEAASPAVAASALNTITADASGARSRKRERVVDALSPLSRPLSAAVKTEPQEDPEEEEERSVPAPAHQQPQALSAQLEVTRGKEEEEEDGHEEHSADPLPSATPGVSTRRSHPPPLKQEDNAEKEVQGSEALVGRSSSSSSSEEGEDDDDDSMELSRRQNSSSRSHSAVPMTPTQPSSATQRSASLTSTSTSVAAGAARPRHEEALEALTQAAITAQERQLRHTLLSIFPAHLRNMAAPTAAAAATTAVGSPPCNPEPLLPLLHALCEDKTFVHAAWSRYEDDVAVQRTQNSIQRKRQRHSFNKGGRKSSTTAATAAAATAAAALLAGSGRAGSDSDGADEGDDQPPQEEWVESAPALTGSPRPPLPHTASQRHIASSSSSSAQQVGADTNSGGGGGGGSVGDDGAVAAAGFQWTPWRFFREKRLRGARRSQGSASAAAAAAAATTTAPGTTSASALPTSAAAAASSTSSQASSSTVAATPATTISTAPSAAAAIGGGVPPLLFSEVPSLPVLQVDAEVPEAVHAVVPAMTAEEQRTYARYVMSSGKLRNVCRDPYTFLVSRAKEMRIQWERQHPFE